ncbi:MAG: hypothetical protein A3J48_04140 [Candidatus Doudnabacteria bacterium RIFCSPHIGHO2_02_FULL_46_11]|uniref:site-specific DNA-methyltransferase (adenine-specific) n=2 Tax=Bacteria candidate phyla TaxID=1783234 RepID=A0A1F5P8S0_9BACT|nr:MAG: hypothetical protein A3I57_02165 [Candidatus Beckwithbacteria bacterium RIFCSPLOWO2_02_FULL_47_23]OGE86303.1 MAG: hypothetical protein A3J48_04140 [Candidatus Doudnabacteria bacterium RIFCSPHIGHO2_02_FULL_46_11]
MKIFSKSEAKQEIAALIKKFEALNSTKRKKYNEANTRKDFILPLFHALNWDVYNSQSSNEVVEEEATASGWIDYSFRLHNLTQFLLEAKAIPADLNKDQWAKQAIEYGWNKGISWVVLTDFEGLKVFSSDWKTPNPRANLTFTYKDYLKRFNDLWLLSRESVEKGELNAQAQKWGITAKRVSVNEVLAQDLVEWREILTNNFRQWNTKISLHDLEESVQRILDRLIFIRVVEDRSIEEKTLWQAYQKWEANGNDPANFIKSLAPIFRIYDEKYNSNLFKKHLCEDLNTDGDPFGKIIPKLYGEKESGIKYRFDAINSDVLGGVYEQYLGKVQQREGVVSKRKKQGIYYTPSYIVEYIVQNTLGKLLKETPGLADREKIKILDPACGSGSFLIKAFELMDENLRKDRPEQALRKCRILTENIYGVDLDEQAIEIARLNLLMKALVPNQKLPMLTEHMKVGNSLIDDPKIDKKAFNWQEEFEDVFKQKNSGFDVIIENPPWGADIDKFTKYFERKYPNSTKNYKDIYKIFIDRSIGLLRSGGYLGLIVPSTFLYQPRYEDIKDLINQYENFVINLGEKIFRGVQLPSCIVVLKKIPGKNKFTVDLTRTDRNKLSAVFTSINERGAESLQQKEQKIEKDTGLTFDNIFLFKDAGINYQAVNIGKARKGQSKLGKLLFYKGGREDPKDIEYWKGSNIDRFYIQEETDLFVRTDYKNFIQPNERVILNKVFFELKPKIVWRQTASRIIATIDLKGVWFGRSILGALIKNELKREINIYYALAIFNSTYINFLYRKKVFETGRLFPQVKLKYLRNLPFAIASEKDQREIAAMVAGIIALYKKLNSIDKSSDNAENFRNKIKKIEKDINQNIYRLYKLNQEEVKIVENQNNSL